MRIIKKDKGITIIAFVVTIVVILILAGVSIGLVLGDNGIISEAKKSKEGTEVLFERETINKAVFLLSRQDKDGKISKDKLENEIHKDINNAEINDVGGEFDVIITGTNRYYTIDSNNNVSDVQFFIKDNYSGDITKDINGKTLSGTEEDPYEIWCIEDIIEWSKNYSKYTSAYIKLARNLNFKSTTSYNDSSSISYGDINKDGNVKTLIEEMQSGCGFNPIDTFSGTFDGNNCTLSNMYIYYSRDDSYVGYFNTLNNANIYNLTISGYIKATKKNITGGIVRKSN